jgi:general secretion pathway protein D
MKHIPSRFIVPNFFSRKGAALFLSLAGLSAAGIPAVAQTAPPGPPVFQPGLTPSAATPPGGAAPSGDFSNFQRTPVPSILDSYEQISGKHLVRDVTLEGLQPITLNASGVSKAEFLKLIEATLLLNGVAIVPIDDHTSKVVNIISPKNPRSEGIKLYANADAIPKGAEVVSYYMPLNYISPAEAVTIFTSEAPVHPYGAYIAAPTAQAVIVTEGADVVRELIALKELIDVPPASVTSEFVQLTRADAEKVADLLNKLLEPKKENSPAGGGGGGPVVVPAGLGNNAPISNERDLLSGPAQIVADPRSNRILIVTRPVNIPFLKQMIAELDRPDNFMQPQRRALKYVLAQDIMPAIAGALAQGKDEETEAKSAVSTTAAGNNNSNPVQGATSTSSNGAQQNGATGQSSGGGGGSNEEQALTDPSQNNVPTILTIGKTRLLADNRSNSIIVFGTPDIVARVDVMIDQLDRKPLQVYLATVIGQLTVGNSVEFGVDLLQKFQHAGSYGLATGIINTPAGAAAGAVPEPQSLITSTAFPLASGATVYGLVGNTLNAYVRALESTNRFKVISRPSVYTTNNKAALIASGSQIPVPASTTSGFTGDANNLVSTSSISYENVLLQLSIIPVINANHQVTLRIRQSNDSVGGSQNISGNLIPIIDTQKIDTEVTVPDRATIVIGGLISDTTQRNANGLPFLSDIPFLGYFFSDTLKTKNRSELIIMISPTVIETDADQILANESEKARTILGHEAENTVAAPAPRIAAVVTQTRETRVRPAGPGHPIPTKTTTTVTRSSPVSPTASLVPAASSPAPDVGKARLPEDPPAAPSPISLP